MLFSIVTTGENDEIVNEDFTNSITVPSYKVNDFDVSEDWEDGNKKKHKDIVRTQVKGSFTLKFATEERFKRFFELLRTKKITTGENSGAVLCNVYVQNRDEVRSIYVFVDADPQNTLPLIGVAAYDGFNVNIEEV